MSVRPTVLVVGGGASGLMAALMASRAGASVTILEQNDRPGKKILATGNGRCNLTNRRMDVSMFRGTDPGFSAFALDFLTSEDVMRCFGSLGLCFKELRDGWVYPRSQQAASVLEILLAEIKHQGIRIRTNTKVLGVEQKSDSSRLSVLVEGWAYEADAVILCNGSKASAISGSDGSGYEIARRLGHTLVPPLPALTGLKTAKSYAWSGVRCQAAVTLFVDGRETASEEGEVQLTDYGISGIPVFQISRYAIRALAEGRAVTASLNFLPDFTPEELAAFLLRATEQMSYKTTPELLLGLLPEKLCRLLGAAKNQKKLLKNLQNFPVTISGSLSYEQAQVCSGGVSTAEVDPTTMESRLCPGLYLAGELLDIDGPCGGYNLQWAWSSGALAGTCAAKRGETLS